MDNKTILKGIIAEQLAPAMEKLRDELEAKREDEIKFFETKAGKEVKERLDDLQGKLVNLNQNTGSNVYRFKGYNTDYNRNFKANLTEDEANVVAKAYLDAIHGKAIDFSSIMPASYGTTMLGLAELSSAALSTMPVKIINAKSFTAPTRATRETANSAAPGKARAASSITAGRVVFTIDEIIGGYAEVLRTDIRDADVDIVNDWIIPLQAEGIGQYTDDEVFNGANSKFTTSIVDVTPTVTASGVAGIAGGITIDNLTAMFYGIAWERGVEDPMWYGSRATIKAVKSLVSTQSGHPIFTEISLNGRPSQSLLGCRYVITPVISDTPGDGGMRLCFGDPNQYVIVTRGDIENLVNPYVKMKEDTIQFIANFEADGNVVDNANPAYSTAWATMVRSDN